MLQISIPDVGIVPSDFNITKSTLSKLNRQARIYGSQQLYLNSKITIMDDAILRGDLGPIFVGMYTYIGQRSVVRPRMKEMNSGLYNTEAKIGDYVIIREDCSVSATKIGNFVYVSEGSIIGNNCVLGEATYVMPNSVLVPESVVPPLSIVSGNPAKVVGQVPIPFREMMKELLRNLDQRFAVQDVYSPEVLSIVNSVIKGETDC